MAKLNAIGVCHKILVLQRLHIPNYHQVAADNENTDSQDCTVAPFCDVESGWGGLMIPYIAKPCKTIRPSEEGLSDYALQQLPLPRIVSSIHERMRDTTV